MTKKLVKLSIIRKEDADPCPFGLSIPFGCGYAGNIIDNMVPLSIAGKNYSNETKDKISKENKKLFTWRLMDSAEEPKKCKYAATIMQNQDAVSCNFGDIAPGIGEAPLFGSPYYSKNISLDGLYSTPVQYYTDYNISRNLFYGIYSIQANKNNEIIILAKEAAKDTAGGTFILFYCPEDHTVLLLERTKNVNSGKAWGFPGGHIQEGEMPEQAAIRELHEEMGFVPDSTDIISSGHIEMNDKGKCVVFIASIHMEAKEKWHKKIKLNWEHDSYKWFKTTEIPSKLHPVAEFILSDSANIQE